MGRGLDGKIEFEVKGCGCGGVESQVLWPIPPPLSIYPCPWAVILAVFFETSLVRAELVNIANVDGRLV